MQMKYFFYTSSTSFHFLTIYNIINYSSSSHKFFTFCPTEVSSTLFVGDFYIFLNTEIFPKDGKARTHFSCVGRRTEKVIQNWKLAAVSD